MRAAIRIVDVDFERKSVRIEASPAAARDAVRLERVARACRARGLTPIVAENHAVVERTPTWSCRDVGLEGCGVEYSIGIDRHADMLDRVTTAVILIGEACAMEEVTRKHLRFCMYELAINTIEHGMFAGCQLELHITIRPEPGAVHVTYRDNGRMFATDGREGVDVGRKIARGEKRGLGLFLLHNLTRMEYRRVRGWNTTILVLESRAPSETPYERRAGMEGITIEIIPCPMKDTAVIKAIGSVDSSTVQAIETQIQGLVSQGSRRLVIDCSEVEFVSSAGIGIFLGTAAQLRGAGGDLLFMKLPPHVEELFDIINLKSFFTVIGSLDELQAATQR